MFETLEEEHAGVVLRFEGKSSGKIASILLSSNEIADYSNSTEEKDPEATLEAQVETSNAQCPMQIGPGMVITHVSIEGDCVVYNVQCDETTYSIAAIRNNMEQAKLGIKKMIDSGDPTMAMFIKICKDAEKGIAYKYIGDASGDACLIKIRLSEL